MRPEEFRVDADPARAATPPAAFYGDPTWFEAVTRRVLARGWHVAADADDLAAPESAVPVTLLPGALDAAIVLTRDRDGALRCLANVCTHRGNLVCVSAGPARTLRCGYHGRVFRLDGAFASMPGFEDVPDFPRPSDSLASFGAGTWGPLVFAAVEPSIPLEELLRPVRERLGWIDFASMRRDEASSRAYEVEANWALYVDNYLEGFHVPFVHEGLAKALDVPSYVTELLPQGVLQTALAADGEPAFEPPAGHPDHGRRVAAYWYWLYPATMLNVYPWGLSLNVVEPISPFRTRVRFASYVLREELRSKGAGGDLHEVELEDEEVVQSVQRGMRSGLYEPGRYSPRHERGVHHFHRLVAAALSGDAARL